jgi:hypothetical protein
MKWLRKRSRDAKKDDSRIYKASSPGMLPRVRRNVPEPHPIFADTGSLAIAEEGKPQADNPYDTAAWSADDDVGLRRADDDKNPGRGKGGKAKGKVVHDPYNTGSFRKGF